ncbi:MAG: hypothetical protein WC116_09975 [Thermovirgaceae bacterium]
MESIKTKASTLPPRQRPERCAVCGREAPTPFCCPRHGITCAHCWDLDYGVCGVCADRLYELEERGDG